MIPATSAETIVRVIREKRLKLGIGYERGPMAENVLKIEYGVERFGG